MSSVQPPAAPAQGAPAEGRPAAEGGPARARVADRWRLRLGTRWHGVLANNASLSEAVGAALLGAAAVPAISARRKLVLLATAARRLRTRPLRAAVTRGLAPHLQADRADGWREARVGWNRYSVRGQAHVLSHSLVLKAPGPGGEKGVLYCSFEHNLLRIVSNPRAREFLAEYDVALATSWSPPDYAVLASVAGLVPDPVFACISNLADVEAFRACEPAIRTVPIMACDWVEPSYYAPRPRAERTIDVLMVANWLRFKRHWILFDALRRMRRDLRVVLVGHKNAERNVEHVKAEARAWGVRQDVEFVTSAPIDEVTRLMCDARVAPLFSRREGSCVAVVECMFADTPVALMRDAHVGSKAYVNDQTGRLFAARDVAGQLSRMLEEAETFRPRAWAMEHLTARRTSARLNAIVRARAAEVGASWTADLAPICWRHVPTYLDAGAAARFAGEEARLAEVYGLTLTKYPHVGPPPA